MAYTRTVSATINKARDVEIHVSNIAVDTYGVFTEIREFIPSLNQYGRGVTFPAELTEEVISGLQKALV